MGNELSHIRDGLDQEAKAYFTAVMHQKTRRSRTHIGKVKTAKQLSKL